MHDFHIYTPVFQDCWDNKQWDQDQFGWDQMKHWNLDSQLEAQSNIPRLKNTFWKYSTTKFSDWYHYWEEILFIDFNILKPDSSFAAQTKRSTQETRISNFHCKSCLECLLFFTLVVILMKRSLIKFWIPSIDWRDKSKRKISIHQTF